MDKNRDLITELFNSKGLSITDQEIEAHLRSDRTDGLNWGFGVFALYSAKMIEAALEKHASALILAADASDKYSRSLVKATWALVAATLVLALVAILGSVTA